MKKSLLASVFSISLHAATIDQVLVESLIEQANTQKRDDILYEITPEKATQLIHLFEVINSSSKENFDDIPDAIKQEYAVSAPLVLHGLLQAISNKKGEKTSDVKLLILDAGFRDVKTLEKKARLQIIGFLNRFFDKFLSFVEDQPHGEIVTKKTLQGIHPETELRYLNDCPENLDDFFLVNFSITLPFFVKGYESQFEKVLESSTLKTSAFGNLQNTLFLNLNKDSFPDVLNKVFPLPEACFNKISFSVDLTPQGLFHRATYPGHSRFKDRTIAAFNQSRYSESRIIDGGSSYSTPMVSNASLLLKANYPTFNAETVANILLASALRTFSLSFSKTNLVLDVVENGKESIFIDSSGVFHLELPFETVSGLYGRGILNFQNADYFAQMVSEQKLTAEELETNRKLLPIQQFENKNYLAVEPGSKWEEISLLLFLRKLSSDSFIKDQALPFLAEHRPSLSAKKQLKQPKLQELDLTLSNASTHQEVSDLLQEFSVWLKNNPKKANELIFSTRNAGIDLQDIKQEPFLETNITFFLEKAETLSDLQALYLVSKIRERTCSLEVRTHILLSLWKKSIDHYQSAFSVLCLFGEGENNVYERFFNSKFIKGFFDPIVDLLETNRDSLGEISNLFVDYMRDPEFSLSEKLLNKVTHDRFPTYALLSLLIDFIKLYKLEPLFETTQKLSSSGRLLSKALTLETPKERDALVFKEFELITPSEISGFMEDITKDYKLLFGIDEQEVGTEIKFYLAGLNQAFSEAKKMMLANKKELN